MRRPERNWRIGRITRDDTGAVMPLIAICLVVLMGMGAFVIDYGYAYANRRALSSAADAAALAGARQIQMDRKTTQTCAQLLTAEQSAISSIATQIGTATGPSGTAIATSTTCAQTSSSNTSVVNPVVTATATAPSSSYFGGIFGRNGYSLTRVAKAIVGPISRSSAWGLRPLAICNTDAASMIDSLVPEAAIQVSIVKTSGTACATASGGNWSVIDFNGGSNSGPELTSWLQDGYSGAIATDGSGYYYADSGANGDSVMKTTMPALLDTQITVPVYDLASGSGNNVRYEVVGFIAATLCGWQVKPIRNNYGHGTCYDSTVGMPAADAAAMQVRFSKAIPPGNIDFTCGIESPTCKYSSMTIKLIQ